MFDSPELLNQVNQQSQYTNEVTDSGSIIPKKVENKSGSLESIENKNDVQLEESQTQINVLENKNQQQVEKPHFVDELNNSQENFFNSRENIENKGAMFSFDKKLNNSLDSNIWTNNSVVDLTSNLNSRKRQRSPSAFYPPAKRNSSFRLDEKLIKEFIMMMY